MKAPTVTKEIYEQLRVAIKPFKQNDLPKIAKIIQVNGRHFSSSTLYRVYASPTFQEYKQKVVRNRPGNTPEVKPKKEEVPMSESKPENNSTAPHTTEADSVKELKRIADALEKLAEYWKPALGKNEDSQPQPQASKRSKFAIFAKPNYE